MEKGPPVTPWIEVRYDYRVRARLSGQKLEQGSDQNEGRKNIGVL